MFRKNMGLMFLAIIVFTGFNNIIAENNDPGQAIPIQRVLAALRKDNVPIEVKDKNIKTGLTWVEAKYYDETYPLTINIVSKKKPHPEKIIYLIPASSLNFSASFFAPIDKSLALYLAENGYLVVGITPREDNVPLDVDQSVMARWGMEKHREDIHTIVTAIQSAIDKPYKIMGHSLGGICALDYAAKYSDDKFETVIVLDTPSFNPAGQPDKIFCAQLSIWAYDELLNNGIYGEYSMSDYRGLLAYSRLYPDADSGYSRAALGLPGNFTFNGLLHFSLIYTAYMPGVITGLTGLPQEWPMIMSNSAGYYNFAAEPAEDGFGLILTDIDRLRLVSSEIGSGTGVLAMARDYTSAIAGIDTYTIDWSNINENVVWINGELGMGSQTYGAELIKNSGNEKVTVIVVPGYGHGDLIFSKTAGEDVWHLLLQ